MNQLGIAQIVLASALIAGSQFPASAAVSFYAPYDDDYDLDVGTPASPTLVNGTIPFVTGFNAYGQPGNAIHVDQTGGEVITYGQASNYLAGVADGGALGANTVRLLYKPDYSGLTNVRRWLFQIGQFTHPYNTIYVHTGDTTTHSIQSVIFTDSSTAYVIMVDEVSWDSSTWFYVGVSWDATGMAFYLRPLTNGSVAATASVSFGPESWDPSSPLDTAPVHIGNASYYGTTSTEGSQGALDDITFFSGERFSVNDFNYDFALVVPEPSSVVLAITAVILLRRRLQAKSR